MPAIFVYILKLSASLALVFLFYQLVLRRLTFYTWNRIYLLGYTLLSFLIPFINISSVLEKNQWEGHAVVRWVPVIGTNIQADPTYQSNAGVNYFSSWNLATTLLFSGMIVLLIRLLIQFISFHRMKKNAIPVSVNGLNIYQVDKDIMPFSFGNSIFINQRLHTETELQEIIRHEFIHVKQKHSLDIIWGELLCLLNWYNPFAWLIRHSIRQNLEFIADNQVLENGINKKEYQYLLLKVIGNNQYSIATQFNFSSLKKRIAMMNKTKSARRQLLRLLFLLPATVLLLLAFRSKWNSTADVPVPADRNVNLSGIVVDVETFKPLPGVKIHLKEKNITVTTDANGYYFLKVPYENEPLKFSMHLTREGYNEFHQQENWGNFYEDHVKRSFGNTYEFFGLGKVSRSQYGFSGIGGNATTVAELNYAETVRRFQKYIREQATDDLYTSNGPVIIDTVPEVKIPNSKGYFIDIKDNKGDCIVVIKNKDQKEVKRILLTEWNERPAHYESLYGGMASPELPGEQDWVVAGHSNVKSAVIDDYVATITLKDGKKETYDLRVISEKKRFKGKYGEPVEMSLATAVEPAREIALTSTRSLQVASPGVTEEPARVLTTTPGTELSAPIPVALAEYPLNAGSPAELGTLKLGGLTMQDKGEYILLDGKEYKRGSSNVLKGTYRISFLDEKDAIKKFGEKGINGAIIVETISK